MARMCRIIRHLGRENQSERQQARATTLGTRPLARAFQSHCLLHLKRESQHHVNGCRTLRIHCIPDCVRLAVPPATEWQRIGNQINAARVAARTHFVNDHKFSPRFRRERSVSEVKTLVFHSANCFSSTPISLTTSASVRPSCFFFFSKSNLARVPRMARRRNSFSDAPTTSPFDSTLKLKPNFTPSRNPSVSPPRCAFLAKIR